jgi:hypothetical protein
MQSRVMSWGETLEALRLFRDQLAETGAAEDALWAVIQRDRARQATVRSRLGRGAPAFDEIAAATLAVVCREYGIQRERLLEPGVPGRQSPGQLVLRNARWVAARALRDQGMSLPLIGYYMERHHSTVIYGLTQIGHHPELVAAADRVRAAMLEEMRHQLRRAA